MSITDLHYAIVYLEERANALAKMDSNKANAEAKELHNDARSLRALLISEAIKLVPLNTD